ncbi:nuclease [Candidatus Parcubacteria bacterium]|nr:MAG: nuclease [Candidatus Parcubacteria bacterium]
MKPQKVFLLMGIALLVTMACKLLTPEGFAQFATAVANTQIAQTPMIGLPPTETSVDLEDVPYPPTEMPAPTATRKTTPTITLTPTITDTATITPTSTVTFTPTQSQTPTITLTPTVTLPAIDVAACVPDDTKREVGIVSKVVDGDTIEVTINGEVFSVRYIGINTPEMGDYFGVYSANKNSELVSWQWVTLVKDVSETDRYGRLLRYVFVGDVFVNYELVRQGFAEATNYPPDESCEKVFREAAVQARTNQIGLWKPTVTPVPPPIAVPPPSVGGDSGGSNGQSGGNCDPAYPTVCIPPPPPDLDCKDIPYRRFQVNPPDPHRFDGDHDGIGCES